jgi:hypothetical protein
MHKTIFLWALLTGGFALTLPAQKGFVTEATTNSYQVFDASGRAFVNPTTDVEGSPYFKDEWAFGSAILGNTRYDGARLRLDLHTQEVHYLDRNNKELVLPKGMVKAVVWTNGPKDSIRFQCGFPAIETHDANSFYLVLSPGKCTLLHLISKSISEQKNEMSGEIKKEYTTYEDYYLYDGKTMQRVKKSGAIIDGKQVKFKTIDELKREVEQYNAL